MLQIKDLAVHVVEKSILQNITLDFEKGKNYAILGRNGSGKSSLAMSIMGHPKYELKEGQILLDGENLGEMDPDERNKLWIFLTFQNVPEIPGVKLFEFLKSSYDIRHEKNTSFMEFKQIVEPHLNALNIDRNFLWRDLNVGFSGGEKRKIEVLQIKLLQPHYIFLDEIDSGLDVNALKEVSELLKSIDTPENTFVIITHIFEILTYLPVDEVIVLDKGKVREIWDMEIIQKIKTEGF